MPVIIRKSRFVVLVSGTVSATHSGDIRWAAQKVSTTTHENSPRKRALTAYDHDGLGGYPSEVAIWIVYFEDEPGFIGVFDIEDDAYEYQRKYAADSGRVVLLTPVTPPWRITDHVFRAEIHAKPAEDT